jgi:hypothetical protein
MAQALGPGTMDNSEESKEVQAFWLEHGEALTSIQNKIIEHFKCHRGNDLLLLEASLRGLLGLIMDGFETHKIKIEVDNNIL